MCVFMCVAGFWTQSLLQMGFFLIKILKKIFLAFHKCWEVYTHLYFCPVILIVYCPIVTLFYVFGASSVGALRFHFHYGMSYFLSFS